MYSGSNFTLTSIYFAECLHMLQSLEASTSLQDLFKKHIQPVLQDLRVSVDSWSLCSPERFIFEAILTYGGTCVEGR
jgi:hypothetical protein